MEEIAKKKIFMKFIIFSYFCFFIILLNSCKKDVFLNEPSSNKENIESNLINEDFNDFLEKFSKDSLFQYSRIDFPLRVSELNDDYQAIETLVQKEDYLIFDFSMNNVGSVKKTDNYFQKVIVNEKDAKLEIRGIDNGIYLDVFFKNIEGKWKLQTWKDSST
jgi:hypothetical protein